MNTRRCLKIAERMNALLLHELGQGVDGLRMVAEPLYARDVLLVCDALPGTELAELAQHFRVAATERPKAEASSARPSAGSGRDRPAAGTRKGKHAGADRGERSSSGFGASVLSRLASGFGFSIPGGQPSLDSQSETRPGAARQPPPRRWFSPSRWHSGK